MPIITYPSNTLRTHSTAKLPDSEVVIEAIAEMKRTIAKYPTAVGIAAPQVGYNVRVFMMKDTNKREVVMINPLIVRNDGEFFYSEEGCLSLPNVKGRVYRHWGVTVVYGDEHGRPQEVDYIGLDAAIVQHEIDHLDGILFTDRLTGGDMKRAKKRLEKLSKGAK